MNDSYTLVNPYIVGNMDTTIKALSPIDAAKKLYSKLSQFFNNNLPQFFFTIKKSNNSDILIGGGSDLYHFIVSEKKHGDTVDFKIAPYDLKDKSRINTFVNKLNQFKNKQNGGFSDDDSSSSSSDAFTDTEQLGGKFDSSSSSDSSSSDSASSDSASSDSLSLESDYSLSIPTFKMAPISYWWYDPQVYFLKKMYIPTFKTKVIPYIQLDLIF